MTQAKQGSKVTLDYEGRLESGEVFDSSKHGDHSHPLEFEVGSGQVIPGFETAVVGMTVDEEKEFSIEPENAYGPRDDRLTKEIPKSALPPEPEPQVGMTLMMRTPQGDIPVCISEVKTGAVVLDFNHPLAGKKLIFKIKVLKIE
ncbi:FKBP-type peptidyl-prolyl cis-trans isomerase [uncultured archaeon]|nr:FKBP-type peptidyl-prolyl cis-trans isomerase [uncultured archaeon]